MTMAFHLVTFQPLFPPKRFTPAKGDEEKKNTHTHTHTHKHTHTHTGTHTKWPNNVTPGIWEGVLFNPECQKIQVRKVEC